jgi:hypothetical protein
MYDAPNMPTLPSAHGWRARYSIVSYPSRASSVKQLKVPYDVKHPRQSTKTTL